MRQERHSDGDGTNVDDILADYMRRVDRGEKVDQQEVIAAHPNLAAELRDYFSQAMVVERFAAGAKSGSDGECTVEHMPSRKDSRGLHIRCPHCSNFVEVVTDTPYEEISCSTCGSTFSLVDREEATRMAAPLKSIDRFDLVTRVGVGGFGTVWKAHDKELDRTVAVKIPRRGQLTPAEIDQFFREARAAAQLRHPNIVPVHEVGRDGDALFIVSDFVRGVTLADWLTDNQISAREVAELCIPITDALQHAHQHGIVHRDLKPSNIMIDEAGRPHLTDFGLAKREVGEITMTVEGQLLGTPGYMSPEQASGQGHWVDRRTDIYSLGVILFQLLTSELPFRGNAQMQVHRRLTEDAPDPRKLNGHVPRDMATICLKCLEREPGRRYATAAELGDEFQRFVRGEPIAARPLSAPARWMRWAKRKPMVATTAALVVFLAVAGPLAALRIASQRQELEVRLTERNRLMDQRNDEVTHATTQISDLRKKLDVWESRANPSEFWPLKRDQPPRKAVIANLLDRSGTTLANQLRDGRFGPEQRARGYFGLAAMASVVGKNSAARDYYQRARDELIALRAKHPLEPHFARALGDCYTRLGHLEEKSNRDQATKDFESARAIYQQLATEHSPNSQYQIDWLDSELKSAMVADRGSRTDHLAQADDINASLEGNWPSDPDEVYRLACYLTQSEPILAQPTTPSAR